MLALYPQNKPAAGEGVIKLLIANRPSGLETHFSVFRKTLGHQTAIIFSSGSVKALWTTV
jgi:hypothetical protein